MTGQGRATGNIGSGDVGSGVMTVELRTVNHRGFKCSIRTSDVFAGLESKIEASIRKTVHRGSVTVTITFENSGAEANTTVNADVLESYIRQCQNAMKAVESTDGQNLNLDVGHLVSLPGVITSRWSGSGQDAIWEQLKDVLNAALANLVQMRRAEGQNMSHTLLSDCDTIRQHVERVSKLAPLATENYRTRLETKVRRVLEDNNLAIEPIDVLREVQIYADKSDVSEEITRLKSHIELFEATLGGDLESESADPVGRKLDFITQEMFRETNTIGSKAAHQQTSAEVVEIKCAIERMRELVQNLE